MKNEPKRLIDWILQPAELWVLVREYFRFGRWQRKEPVNDPASLKHFLQTRASFVAQTSLYGYLRTRAGMRYPELFDDDPFVVSINIAKWHIWLACLSDLAVYTGGLFLRDSTANSEDVGQLIQDTVAEILAETGHPEEAGNEFAAHAERVRTRLTQVDWEKITDDEGPFSESPSALVHWSPVIDELKQLDQGIVINSVRFRWQKVRQDLRSSLDVNAVLGLSG